MAELRELDLVAGEREQLSVQVRRRGKGGRRREGANRERELTAQLKELDLRGTCMCCSLSWRESHGMLQRGMSLKAGTNVTSFSHLLSFMTATHHH